MVQVTAPVRIQLSRAKGSKMPAGTIKVDRSSKMLGNPWVHDDVSQAVAAYKGMLEGDMSPVPGLTMARAWKYGAVDRGRAQEIRQAVLGLRGKSLGCWCAVGSPCHADVQLEFANR